jgi:acyl-CoA dehydrogenase
MSQDSTTFASLLSIVRRFVRERLVPIENQVAEFGSIPEAIIRQMRELGLYGLSIPESYGGLGLNMEEEVRVVFELGYTSPAFRSAVGTNIGIGSQAIVIDGTEEQRHHYLPRLASGELVGSFALTEPDAGSDALALKTRARRDGDHYVLNGTKRYITNAPVAGLFTVLAKTGNLEGASSISCFLVDANTAGLVLGKPDKKMGQAGALTCDVIFEDCRIPTKALLGEIEGNGFRTAMKVLDKGRLHIAALCVGIAERLIFESVRFAAERKQFKKPIANFQLVQAMIADSQTEMLAAKAMVLDAAHKRDAGQSVTLEAACSKLFSSEMVGRVADRAVQIHGGAGYMCEYPVERFYRDVRLFRIFEGTSQIQQIIIARETMKLHGYELGE